MKYNEHICKECRHMIYDVLGNARCAEKGTQIVSEYLPACLIFEGNSYGRKNKLEYDL